jgi:hypothetical protein
LRDNLADGRLNNFMSKISFAVASLLFCAWLGLDARAASVPTLDEMAGDWMPASIVSNPPDVNNFNQMLIVNNRDLTSFYCHPCGLFTHTKDPGVQWTAGYPLVTLQLDGVAYAPTDLRWFAYKALRRNLDCAGLAVETDTRMVNEQRGVLCRVTVTNPAAAAKPVELTLLVPGQLDGTGPGVVNTKQNPRTTTALQPATKPDSVTVEGDHVVWHWKVSIPPGGKTTIGYVAGDGTNDQADATKQAVDGWAKTFDQQMDAFQAVWEKRWADAFTPGNDHFSGNLPVLTTDNAALKRNYYMGALTMLDLERTQIPIKRGFVTSGERGDGTQYFWDASMQATAWALLEPEGMKATLRRWLVQNPRGSPHISLHDAAGYDHKVYPKMGSYAANACTIFNTADAYLRLTRDDAFLDEKLENGKTVLENMDELATDWETLPKGPDGLVDYGGPGQLLETPGLYVQEVASVNSQNISMMREDANWQDFKGNAERAKELRDKATAFLPLVMNLFNTQTGAWNLHKVDGTVVPVQHCFDYIYAGNALVNDFTPAQKEASNNFVKQDLMTHDWMRAMGLADPNVPRAVRPDHSWTGSYDGWLPLTAATMWRLGDPKAAFDFYCRAVDVTKEGPFAQAHEFYGPDIKSNDAPVRIALRGSNMKECISGVAFADVVINTFFGFMPSIDGKEPLVDPATPRPFSGTLEKVRFGPDLLTLTADASGVKVTTPGK